MRGEITLEVGSRVVQRHAVLLQKGVHLETRLVAEQTSNLILRQDARAISLNGDRLEDMPRDVIPFPLRPAPMSSGSRSGW